MSLYSIEIKLNRCLLISCLSTLLSLLQLVITYIHSLCLLQTWNDKNIVEKMKMALQQYNRVPIFRTKQARLNECNRPRKKKRLNGLRTKR